MKFGPEAEVLGVESSLEYWEVRIWWARQDYNTKRFQDFLAALREFLPGSSIESWQEPRGAFIAFAYTIVPNRRAVEVPSTRLASEVRGCLPPEFRIDIKDSVLE